MQGDAPQALSESVSERTTSPAKAPRRRSEVEVESDRQAGREAPRGFRVLQFLREVRAELKRVEWPDRETVVRLTGVVIAFVIITGAYLGLLDAVLSRLVQLIL